MSPEPPFGQGTRMLTLAELCQWLNITERHARKLVARGAIPYRKVGHLLRFAEQEIEQWSRPHPRPADRPAAPTITKVSATPRRARAAVVLPKSLIDWPTEQENDHAQPRSA
jgi:excisionase family DNA binding protein